MIGREVKSMRCVTLGGLDLDKYIREYGDLCVRTFCEVIGVILCSCETYGLRRYTIGSATFERS